MTFYLAWQPIWPVVASLSESMCVCECVRVLLTCSFRLFTTFVRLSVCLSVCHCLLAAGQKERRPISPAARGKLKGGQPEATVEWGEGERGKGSSGKEACLIRTVYVQLFVERSESCESRLH